MVWRHPLSNMDQPLNPEHEQEARLVEQARAGSDRAFAALLARYQQPVFRLIFFLVGHEDEARTLARIALKHALLHMPRVPNGHSIRPWLLRVASLVALDAVRERADSPQALLASQQLSPPPGAPRMVDADPIRRPSQPTGSLTRQPSLPSDRAPLPVDPHLTRATTRDEIPLELEREVIRRLLASLPEGDAELLALGVVGQVATRDLAALAGTSQRSIRRRIARALIIFQQRYQTVMPPTLPGGQVAAELGGPPDATVIESRRFGPFGGAAQPTRPLSEDEASQQAQHFLEKLSTQEAPIISMTPSQPLRAPDIAVRPLVLDDIAKAETIITTGPLAGFSEPAASRAPDAPITPVTTTALPVEEPVKPRILPRFGPPTADLIATLPENGSDAEMAEVPATSSIDSDQTGIFVTETDHVASEDREVDELGTEDLRSEHREVAALEGEKNGNPGIADRAVIPHDDGEPEIALFLERAMPARVRDDVVLPGSGGDAEHGSRGTGAAQDPLAILWAPESVAKEATALPHTTDHGVISLGAAVQVDQPATPPEVSEMAFAMSGPPVAIQWGLAAMPSEMVPTLAEASPDVTTEIAAAVEPVEVAAPVVVLTADEAAAVEPFEVAVPVVVLTADEAAAVEPVEVTVPAVVRAEGEAAAVEPVEVTVPVVVRAEGEQAIEAPTAGLDVHALLALERAAPPTRIGMTRLAIHSAGPARPATPSTDRAPPPEVAASPPDSEPQRVPPAVRAGDTIVVAPHSRADYMARHRPPWVDNADLGGISDIALPIDRADDNDDPLPPTPPMPAITLIRSVAPEDLVPRGAMRPAGESATEESVPDLGDLSAIIDAVAVAPPPPATPGPGTPPHPETRTPTRPVPRLKRDLDEPPGQW